MDFVLLKTFLKVAAVGSITKAAAVLFVTQSAVSRRIKLLEEYVGSPLFERAGTVLKPTAAGQLLIDRGRKILEIEHDFFDNLTTRQDKQKISFCCTPSLGMHRLSGFLGSFVASHGKTIDLSCVFTMPEEALAGIDSGRFDLALIEHCDEVDLKNHVTHQLPDDEVVFVSSPSRGIPEGEVGVERLFEERLYLKNQHGCAKRFIDKNLRTLERSCGDFAGVVYFDDLSFVINEVLAGNGISFVSKGFVEKELRAGQLVSHRVAGFHHFRPRTMILAREHLSPLVESFVQALFAEFRISGSCRSGTKAASGA
ncbi:LysR family transcriptional regulator [Geomobilimonas luticola]|uniref:LysR family transcriptional regulator n=1 Tax=Geomobilimonas luticola TaxID=1114878 RepID=A0ABS5S9L6_9BACT|nr:LysR family transcriptional regulator [Geomobilimonas luticola]MBT0652075.1 LysR family transcriptional regulator [Geomobilimonas luticola]